MNDTDDLARRIYQSLLDGIGDAIRLCDFSRYRPFFHFPHQLETFEGATVVETPAALNVMFDGMCSRLQDLGVTELTRNCTVAQFGGPDTIRGCHDTRLISDDAVQHEAYSALSTLRLIDGQWQVVAAQYAEDNASLPTRALRDNATSRHKNG